MLRKVIPLLLALFTVVSAQNDYKQLQKNVASDRADCDILKDNFENKCFSK
jgi:hypothetical protein